VLNHYKQFFVMITINVGDRYGRLRVVSLEKDSKVKCLCDCGKTSYPTKSNLSKGDSKSCGCLRRERLLASVTSHNHSGTKTHNTWVCMKTRCLNPKSTQYKWYGAQGITIDPKWLTFEGFLEDMGERPKGHTLDRVDASKGYCKENCRWSTQKEQMRNTRRSRTVTYSGESMPLIVLSERLGLNYKHLHATLKRCEGDVEKAVAHMQTSF